MTKKTQQNRRWCWGFKSQSFPHLEEEYCGHEGEALTVAHLFVVHAVGLANLVESLPVGRLLEVAVAHVRALDVPVDHVLCWGLLQNQNHHHRLVKGHQ